MPTTATTEAPSATGERQETVLMAIRAGAPASPGDTCAANGLELSDSGKFRIGLQPRPRRHGRGL